MIDKTKSFISVFYSLIEYYTPYSTQDDSGLAVGVVVHSISNLFEILVKDCWKDDDGLRSAKRLIEEEIKKNRVFGSSCQALQSVSGFIANESYRLSEPVMYAVEEGDVGPWSKPENLAQRIFLEKVMHYDIDKTSKPNKLVLKSLYPLTLFGITFRK